VAEKIAINIDYWLNYAYDINKGKREIVTMTQAQFRMIEDNLDPEVITEKTIDIINTWLIEEQIKQNDVQKAMMLSHVKAMVNRSKTLEQLPEVDPSMFDELSQESMALARRTVALFDNLPVEEAYLLAVHYEVARANEE